MARRRERPAKDVPNDEAIERNHAIDWSTVFHADPTGDNAETASSRTAQAPAEPPQTSPPGGAHDWSSVLRSDLAGAAPAQQVPPPPGSSRAAPSPSAPAPQASSAPAPSIPPAARVSVPPTPVVVTPAQVEQQAPAVPPTSPAGSAPAEPAWMSGMRSILTPIDPASEQLFQENLGPDPQPQAPSAKEASPNAPLHHDSIFDELTSSPNESDSVFDVPPDQLEDFGSEDFGSEPATADDPNEDSLGLPTGLFDDPAPASDPVADAESIPEPESSLPGPAGIFGGPSGWFDALLHTDANNDLERRAEALEREPDLGEEPSRSFLDIVGGEDLGPSDDDEDVQPADDAARDETDDGSSDADEPEPLDANRYGRLELRTPTDEIELLLISTEIIGVFGIPPVRCEVNLCPPGTQLDILTMHFDSTVWSADDADVVWDYLSGWLPKIWVTLAGKRRTAGTVVETWLAYKDDMMPGEQHLRTVATLDPTLNFEKFSRIQRDAIEERTGGRWFDAVEVRSDE